MIVAACLGAFVVFIFHTPDGIVYACLLAARYLMQTVRLVIFFRQQRAVARSSSKSIDFSQLDEDDIFH